MSDNTSPTAVTNITTAPAAPVMNTNPFASFVTLLGSRKGLVVALTLFLSFIAFMVGKLPLAEFKWILVTVIPAYLASQAYEDGQKHQAAALVASSSKDQ